MDIPTYLGFINLIGAIAVAGMEFSYWSKNRTKSWAWVKFAYGMCGILWAVVYVIWIYYQLTEGGVDVAEWLMTVTRPAVTLTLFSMLAGAIVRRKEPKCK
jgi:hypothetical protein